MAIEAVTFDFWNTLVNGETNRRDERIDTWHGLLAAAGRPIAIEVLEAAWDVGWYDYVKHWNLNIPFGAAEVVQVVLAELGVDAEPVLARALLDAIIDPPPEQYPPLNPNLAATLTVLRDAGVKIGIVCDVGLTPSPILRRHLDTQDVLGYFDHWSFSDEVGVYKPDAKIFRHALDGLGGIAPQRAAHVGDLRRTDILGAKTMGMTAVRYTCVHDDPNPPDAPVIEGDHVIADLAELPEVLGIV